MPTTTVKNSTQAAQLGVPVGTSVPIFVPAGQSPQGMVNAWANKGTSQDFLTNLAQFTETWLPASMGGQNDFKNQNLPTSTIYDAYGNFEYGATGRAVNFSMGTLQGAAELVHGGTNNTINQNDIANGFNTIRAGGVLSTVSVRSL